MGRSRDELLGSHSIVVVLLVCDGGLALRKVPHELPRAQRP